MEFKCIIVDDEPPAQRVLENYVAEVPLLKLEAKCKNALEAAEVLHQKDIDIMFLDINMPKMSGLSFLQTLKKPPIVIITTAYRDYAVESFELDVLDYLKKPFSLDRFIKAVNKAIDRLRSSSIHIPFVDKQHAESTAIFVKEYKVVYQVNLSDILYIESIGDYVKIITDQKVYVTKQTMKKMELLLPPSRFVRIHKSFIISFPKISLIDGNLVHIGKSRIPIGQSYQKAFWELVDAYGK